MNTKDFSITQYNSTGSESQGYAPGAPSCRRKDITEKTDTAYRGQLRYLAKILVVK